jgi:hypothetical protein
VVAPGRHFGLARRLLLPEGMKRTLAGLAVSALVFWIGDPRIWACGGPLPTPVVAFPRSGATGVSPRSSIFISTPNLPPAGLVVEANGQAVPLPDLLPVGTGPQGTWWQLRGGLRGGLRPDTTYVVRVEDGGVSKQLTTFVTSPQSSETAGTAPEISRLRLWRVHYGAPGTNGGDCVSSEFEGYIDVDYTPGALPDTPPDELLNVLTLSPKDGGPSQTLVFTGSERIHLARHFDMNGGGLQDVPDGKLPSPIHAGWKPELAPDRAYCATLTIYGRNDLAIPLTTSLPACAPVMNAEAGSDEAAPRLPPDGGAPDAGDLVCDGGHGDASPADGGPTACSMGRGRPASWWVLLVGVVAVAMRGRRRRRSC